MSRKLILALTLTITGVLLAIPARPTNSRRTMCQAVTNENGECIWRCCPVLPSDGPCTYEYC